MRARCSSRISRASCRCLPEVTSARGDAPVPERFDVIRAGEVSFTYPSRSEPSLQDVSLELPEGEVIALVGENGSGKTTLAKILAGLYPPGAGSVLWDGADIAQFDPGALRARVAILFQDFCATSCRHGRTSASATDAWSMTTPRSSPRPSPPGRTSSCPSCPNGYATMLGPEFYGGVDLVRRAVAARRAGPGVPARRPADHPRRADGVAGSPLRSRAVRAGARPVRRAARWF